MARVATLAAEVTADIGPLKTQMSAAGRSVQDFTRRARTESRRFDDSMRTANRSSGAFGRGIQNAAFQVGDFAVQVGGGTSAVRAMSMQLPQLLGGFGVLGAVAGAAVAIIGPLAQSLFEAGDAAERTARQAEDLEGALSRLGQSRGNISQLVSLQNEHNQAMADSARISTQATNVIIANTRREFEARQALIRARDLPEAQREIDQYAAAIGEASNRVTELDGKLARLTTLSGQRAAAGLETTSVGEDYDRLLADRNAAAAEVRLLDAQMELALIRASELNEAMNSVFGVSTEGGGSVSVGGGGGRSSRVVQEVQTISSEMERLKDMTRGQLGEMLGAWSGYFTDLGNVMQSGNDRVLKIAKAFAAAEALVNAYRAATQALADPTVPFWGKAAAYAQVLAAGVGAVNAIKGVSMGGAGGGAGGAAAAGGGASFSQTAVIQLNGSEGATYSKSQVRDLINQINEAVEGGARIRLA